MPGQAATEFGFEPQFAENGDWPCGTCGGPLGAEGRDGNCGDCTQAQFDAENGF